MLPSARQACTLRLATSTNLISQALPAESSKQAILRAAKAASLACVRSIHHNASRPRSSREQTVTKRSRHISSGIIYSAAVALEEDVQDRERSSQHQHQHHSFVASHRRYPEQKGNISSPSNQPPDHNRNDEETKSFELDRTVRKKETAWVDSWLQSYDINSLPPSPLPPLEAFRGLIPTQPILALLTLTTLSQIDLATLRHSDVRQLINRANCQIREDPAIILRVKSEDAAKSLRILRAVTFSLPSEKSTTDAFMGKYFTGKTLRHYLYLCQRLGVPRLAKAVFQERLRAQIDLNNEQPEQPILDVNGIARDLSLTRQWKIIVEYFSLETFPHRFYTPELISIYMQAHFGIHQGSKVPRIFDLYHQLDLIPTADSLNHLVQAYLELGDLPTARAIVQEANVTGVSDYATQQLAILRGYRALGLDVDLEKRVLEDIERLQLPLEARLLNALIRLRLDAGDNDAARELLSRFDLDELETQGGVEPTEMTIRLAITLVSRTGTVDQLETIWDSLLERPHLLSDQMIAAVVKAMSQFDLLDEACQLVQSGSATGQTTKVSNDTSIVDQEKWQLPAGIQPGNSSLNCLLDQLSRKEGIVGFEQTMKIMHSLNINPDKFTIKIVVDFARANFQHSPHELSTLISGMIKLLPNVKPTQSLLDTLFADAVASTTRHRSSKSTSTSATTALGPSLTEDTFSPTAGLRFAPPMGNKSSVLSVIQSLQEQDSQSGRQTLASRLQFDAMTSSSLSSTSSKPTHTLATIDGSPKHTQSSRIVWNALMERGFKPDQRHFIALMRGYSAIGHMNSAQDLLVLAEQVGVPITKEMLMVLIVGWGKIQRGKYARKIYKRIKDDSKSKLLSGGLDIKIVTAIIQALVNSGQYSEAAKLSKTDLKNLGVKLDDRAIVVSSQALRASGDLKGSLEILSSNGPNLSPVGRRMVKGIVNYLEKRIKSYTQLGLTSGEGQGQGDSDDVWILREAKDMLRLDQKVRPLNKRRWRRLGRSTRSWLIKSLRPAKSEIHGAEITQSAEKNGNGNKVKEKEKEHRVTAISKKTEMSEVGYRATEARRGRRRSLGLKSKQTKQD